MFYYDLTSLAIKILAKMKIENYLGRGWSKVLKNKMDEKVKLVQVILSKGKNDNRYHLDQLVVLDMCSTMWDAAKRVSILHYNDCIRVFGIVMTIPENRGIFG